MYFVKNRNVNRKVSETANHFCLLMEMINEILNILNGNLQYKLTRLRGSILADKY